MVKRLLIQILLIAACWPLKGEARVVRCAADLTTALRDSSETNCTFDLTATITYVCTNGINEVTTMAAADETGASLFRAEDHRCLAAAPHHGDKARLTGFIEQGIHGYRFAILTSFRPLQSGPSPAPVALTIDDLLDARSDFTLCQTTGLLMDAAYSTATHYWIILELSDGASRIFAVVPSFGPGDIERLSRLIGRQISATGIGVPYDHGKRPRIGRLFKIASIDDIRPADGGDTHPSAELPFIESIQIKSPTDFATLGPHRARGHVVAAWQRGHAILRTENDEMIGVELIPGAELPAYGDYIEASGLPTTDLIHLNLYNSKWQRMDRQPLPPEKPTAVRIAQLTPVSDKNYQQLLFCLYHGRVIRFTGIVRSVTSENEGRQLYVESDGCLVPVETSAIPTMPDAAVGCKVDVTGTCVLDVSQQRAGSLFHRIRGFFVVLRTPADLRVISSPSWWTPLRFLAVICALLAALLAVFIWNRILRRLVDNRSRQLLKAQVETLASTLRVNERTRLAVELHDALSQMLSGVSMQIDAAAGFADGKTPTITKCLRLASRTIDACRMELRNTLWDLRSAALDEPTMDTAIRKTLCQNLAGIDLSVRFNVAREMFSDNTAHAVLKIIRELATNAIRHGHATSLKIAGTIDGDKLLFSVRDNGCGFDPDLVPGISEGHFGLQGIFERLERLNGKMKIESTKGVGTKVTVTL